MKILVTGSTGLLGSALSRTLPRKLDKFVFFASRTHGDLENRREAHELLQQIRPDKVLHCAAVVGGIGLNVNSSHELFFRNRLIDQNVLEAALEVGVRDVVAFASNCIFPTTLQPPYQEAFFDQGPIEVTNYGYGLAKRQLIQTCQMLDRGQTGNFKVLIPSNMYGMGDNFSLDKSHLMGAIVRKTLDAKRKGESKVTVWGSGKPKRELLFSDDLANWLWSSMHYAESWPSVMNMGQGEEHSVKSLYLMASRATRFPLELSFDKSKPEGTKSKLLDSTTARNGFNWNPRTSIEEGISKVFENLSKLEATT